jgi:hypothetical protein
MTRRLFLAAFLPGTSIDVAATQFEVSGQFEYAGQQHDGYFSLGQSLALMIDPQKLPAMHAQAVRLVGSQARVLLEKA